MIRAGGNIAAGARLWEPKALIVLLGQGHCRVKANDREFPGDIQDGLNNRFADGWIQVVQLRGIVPGHTCAVIAVIDEFCLPAAVIVTFENHCRVAAGVVMVLKVDADAGFL